MSITHALRETNEGVQCDVCGRRWEKKPPPETSVCLERAAATLIDRLDTAMSLLQPRQPLRVTWTPSKAGSAPVCGEVLQISGTSLVVLLDDGETIMTPSATACRVIRE